MHCYVTAGKHSNTHCWWSRQVQGTCMAPFSSMSTVHTARFASGVASFWHYLLQFQISLMGGLPCRTSEAFSWCSGIFIYKDFEPYAKHELSSTNVICGKCCRIRGFFKLKIIWITVDSSIWTSISINCLWQVSDTHDQLLAVLSTLNFNTQEFILSPLQFGVPYSRPRYFCLVRTCASACCSIAISRHILATCHGSYIPLSSQFFITPEAPKCAKWAWVDSRSMLLISSKNMSLPST